MLIWVVLSALVAGALSPWLLSASWGVPFGHLPVSTVLRASAIPFAIALVVGTVTEGCLAAVSRSDGVVGALVGGAVALGLSTVSARRSRRLKGIFLEVLRLRSPETREAAIHGLERILARARPNGGASHEHFAELVLLAARGLSEIQRLADAARLLETVELDRLSPARAATVSQALATCLVRAGDVAAAKAALARVPRPAALESVERWISALDALFLALEGESEEALARAAALEGMGDPGTSAEDAAAVRASIHLVRAHALAALGRTSEAREALGALRELAGNAGLDQAMHPAGPASELARRLRAKDPPRRVDPDAEAP